MSLTTKQLVDSHINLSELTGLDRKNQLVLSSAVRIRASGALRKTKAAFEDYVAERNALVEKYGEEAKEDDKNPNGVKKGQKWVPTTSINYKEFNEKIKEMEAEEQDITLCVIKMHELFGVTEKELKDENRDSRTDNQVPLDLIGNLQDLGIVPE